MVILKSVVQALKKTISEQAQKSCLNSAASQAGLHCQAEVRFWRGSYLCSLCCQDELPSGCLCGVTCDLVLSCKRRGFHSLPELLENSVCFGFGHICRHASGSRGKGVLTSPGTKLASRTGSKCRVPSEKWDSSFPLACHESSDFLGAYLS